VREQLSRWYRFLTVYIPDDYLSGFVGIAMAWQLGAGSEFWLRATLLMIGGVAFSLFVHAIDNIVGFRNGHDILAAEDKHERLEPKLLVEGRVSMREAWAATILLLAVGVGITIYFVATSPWPGIVLGVGTLLVLCQYSVGLKLSHHGLGEFALFLTGMGTPIAFILVSGRVEPSPFLVGLMLGLFFAGVNVTSNQADYEFDCKAERKTLAVLLGRRNHQLVGGGLVLAGWAIFAASIATGALPPTALILLVLVFGHVKQLRHLFAGEPLLARESGFRALRQCFGLVLICVAADRMLS
jgi:1,4-dihydroxy-2-naphthoate octaprenyltransferase